MNHMLFDSLENYIITYLDNILICSTTKKEHFISFNKVFSRLVKSELVFKESKYAFFLNSIMFLGYIVSAKHVSI